MKLIEKRNPLTRVISVKEQCNVIFTYPQNTVNHVIVVIVVLDWAHEKQSGSVVITYVYYS